MPEYHKIATEDYVNSQIPTVPSNISSFNNDAGYVTSSAMTSAISDVEASCRFKFDTLEVSEGTIYLDANTAGTFTPSDSSNLTISMNAAPANFMREAWLTIDATNLSSDIALTFPSGFHAHSSSSDLACTYGETNVYHITEYRPSNFMVERWLEQ